MQILSGPFGHNYNDSRSVDFSVFLTIDNYNIIIPITLQNDIWSFIGPLDFEVWSLSLVSVPMVILILAMVQRPLTRVYIWKASMEFVVRNILSEGGYYRRAKKTIFNTMFYHNFLFVIWIWACFIIMKSYAGNLTAMITRPKLNMKFTELEHLVNQDEVTLVIEDGVEGIEYMKQYDSDYVLRQIIDKTERLSTGWEVEWTSNCFTDATQYTGRHASICDSQGITHLISSDFSENGKCNWYTLKRGFYYGPLAMAFQVHVLYIQEGLSKFYLSDFSEGQPIFRGCK